MTTEASGTAITGEGSNICSETRQFSGMKRYIDSLKLFTFDPLATPFVPAARTIPRLNPRAPSFTPSSSQAPPTAGLAVNYCHPPIVGRSKLNPLALAFSPSTSSGSPSWDPEVPAFLPDPVSYRIPSPELGAGIFVPRSRLAAKQEPAPVKSQTAPLDDSCFKEDAESPTAVVNLGATQSESLSPSNIVSPDDIERSNQQALIHQEPDIHHFNWMGQGIMVKTTTPAAVSLTVALTPAKARFVDQENLRDHTMLREAMLTIDPVIFYGNIDDVKGLKGEALREAAIGAAAVYYTSFGRWKDGTYGQDDEHPRIDDLDMTRYIEGTTVINGWLENGAPTRQDFWNEAEEAYHSMLDKRKKTRDERKLFGIGNSSLRFVMRADGSEDSAAIKQQPLTDAYSVLTTSPTPSCGNTLVPSLRSQFQDDLFKNKTWADDLDEEEEEEEEEEEQEAEAEDEENHNVAHVKAVYDDDLFENASWAHDIDKEEDDYCASANVPDVAGPSENITCGDQPVPGTDSLTVSKQLMKERDEFQVAALPPKNVNEAEKDQALNLAVNLRPVTSIPGGFRFAPMVPLPQRREPSAEPSKLFTVPAVSMSLGRVHALEPCSYAELKAKNEEIYGITSTIGSQESTSPDESFALSMSSSSSTSERTRKPAAADETGALDARSQQEIDEEVDFLYGPEVAANEPAEILSPEPFTLPFRPKLSQSPIRNSFTIPIRSKLTGLVVRKALTLPIRSKPAEYLTTNELTRPIRSKDIQGSALDRTTRDYILEGEALVANVERRLTPKATETVRAIVAGNGKEAGTEAARGEEADVSSPLQNDQEQGQLDVSNEPVVDVEPAAEDDIVLEQSSTGEGEAFREDGPVEEKEALVEGEPVVGEAPVVEDGSIGGDEPINLSFATLSKQAILAPSKQGSPQESLGDSRERLPEVVSPLACKTDRSPPQVHPVASDHQKVAIPKFSLVSSDMAAIIRPYPRKLEQIEEGGEDASNKALSNMDAYFLPIAEDEEANATVDLAVSQGHIMLKRSSFIANLSALLPGGSDLDPSTPERSPPPSPYQRPASNTPNAMLGKKLEFSFAPLGEGGSSTENLVGTRGVGAIFEDEDEFADDTSILCNAPASKDGPIDFEPSFISHSFGAMPEYGTDSGSAYSSDDIFTAHSAGTTAPTTVASSEEGSPSPTTIAKPARRLTLVAEPSPEISVGGRQETLVREQLHMHKHKSSWASIQTSLSRRPAHGYTAAADVQFARTQRRKSSWTKVENKLQKPAVMVDAAPEKKKCGLRKALKKVKDTFVKGFKALA
jgi:hypothetical protein